MITAQPVALDTGITIREYHQAKGNSVRLVYDEINDQLFYATGEGDIYSVKDDGNGNAQETFMFTALDHEIGFVQGMAIREGMLVVCGNNNAFEPTTTGRVSKAVHSAGNNWTWSILATTEPYESANNFDHLFSGIIITQNKSEVIWCSGARGTHGEIQTYDGLYPSLRGLPITSILLKIPTNSNNINLLNDSTWLVNSGYLYARGTRNFFDFEYTADGKLFALENSGDRDDPEEMNEIIPGAHYGYPWTMGGNDNPMQFTPFNPDDDKLINKYCNAYKRGYFYNDPNFPQAPNINFKEPVRNYGPDADFYRDPSTGEVKKASDTGGYITSFSSHRSPLGLVFENNNLQDSRLKNKGFMLSWTPGGDANGWRYAGNDTLTGTFVDESEDLVMLSPRNGSFNEIHAHQLIKGFKTPIDLVIARNKMYVLEYNYVDPKIYEISFSGTTEISEYGSESIKIFPNPVKDIIKIKDNRVLGLSYHILDVSGKQTMISGSLKPSGDINVSKLPTGVYQLLLETESGERKHASFIKE